MTSTQALTEAAPTLNDGVLLEGVAAVVPTIHAPGGQTFTGAGKLLGYVKRNGSWVRAPRSDVALDSVAGLQDADLDAIRVFSPRDRFALIASAVGLSGGTQITLELYCVNRSGSEVT